MKAVIINFKEEKLDSVVKVINTLSTTYQKVHNPKIVIWNTSNEFYLTFPIESETEIDTINQILMNSPLTKSISLEFIIRERVCRR